MYALEIDIGLFLLPSGYKFVMWNDENRLDFLLLWGFRATTVKKALLTFPLMPFCLAGHTLVSANY